MFILIIHVHVAMHNTEIDEEDSVSDQPSKDGMLIVTILVIALYSLMKEALLTVADPGVDPHGAKEPPFGLDLVLRSIDDTCSQEYMKREGEC